MGIQIVYMRRASFTYQAASKSKIYGPNNASYSANYYTLNKRIKSNGFSVLEKGCVHSKKLFKIYGG